MVDRFFILVIGKDGEMPLKNQIKRACVYLSKMPNLKEVILSTKFLDEESPNLVLESIEQYALSCRYNTCVPFIPPAQSDESENLQQKVQSQNDLPALS